MIKYFLTHRPNQETALLLTSNELVGLELEFEIITMMVIITHQLSHTYVSNILWVISTSE